VVEFARTERERDVQTRNAGISRTIDEPSSNPATKIIGGIRRSKHLQQRILKSRCINYLRRPVVVQTACGFRPGSKRSDMAHAMKRIVFRRPQRPVSATRKQPGRLTNRCGWRR
jgi:hypothetical protein